MPAMTDDLLRSTLSLLLVLICSMQSTHFTSVPIAVWSARVDGEKHLQFLLLNKEGGPFYLQSNLAEAIRRRRWCIRVQYGPPQPSYCGKFFLWIYWKVVEDSAWFHLPAALFFPWSPLLREGDLRRVQFRGTSSIHSSEYFFVPSIHQGEDAASTLFCAGGIFF